MRRIRQNLGALVATTVLTLAPLEGVLAQAKISMSIGYHSLWATVGEVYETLRYTNILALNGIDAKFHTFTYGGPIGEAYVAGHIDNLVAADVPVLRGVARRPGKVIGRTHDWQWAILAAEDSPTKSLADLKGRKLAAPFGAAAFPRVMRKLIDAGVKDPFRELTLINQDVAEQASALQGKLVDAVVTWEPTMNRLVSMGLARSIYESGPGEAQGWQALSQDFLGKHGEDGAVRFLKAWVMAIWWTSHHMDQAQGWFAKTSRMSVEMLKVSQMHDRYLRKPVSDMRTIDFMIGNQDVDDVQRVMDFQVEHKLMTSKTNAASFIDMSYLGKAKAEIQAGRHPALDQIRVVEK